MEYLDEIVLSFSNLEIPLLSVLNSSLHYSLLCNPISLKVSPNFIYRIRNSNTPLEKPLSETTKLWLLTKNS